MKPQQFLEQTIKLAANLREAKRKAVFVGLPAEKVGGKIYGEGMTVLRIGAIHEYGATINHPGGTAYVMRGGKAQFVSNSYNGTVAGVTKPHTIKVPQRSFLRTPFAIKRKEVNKAIAAQFERIAKGEKVEIVMGRIGVTATNISKGAFTSLGYGTWTPIKPATAQRKGSGQTLIDTGILRSSITWVIRDAT